VNGDHDIARLFDDTVCPESHNDLLTPDTEDDIIFSLDLDLIEN
jgi:hypothetical protein